jgi:hypothetical protein
MFRREPPLPSFTTLAICVKIYTTVARRNSVWTEVGRLWGV